MPLPRVVAVDDPSPAARAGLAPGDEIVAISGEAPRDVIHYQQLVDPAEVEIEFARGGRRRAVTVTKHEGQPLGVKVDHPLFDQVCTCDNHCEFCFIYQLPKGLRRSLYLKDDDYRLSFLYGNFTTLTRFTEADLERVVTERLSPLFVSIHATDPLVRARMLRNRRGATSLRWLRALLDHGIEVHGQVVVCPGRNDGPVLEDTLAGILGGYPELATVAVVPLGISRFSAEGSLRPHSRAEAAGVVEKVEEWQSLFRRALGRRLVFASDEYYLLSGLPFPEAAAYEGFPQHENGVGIVRAFVGAFRGDRGRAFGARRGFFSSVDGAPAHGYRAQRARPCDPGRLPPPEARGEARATVLTGRYGATVLGPLIAEAGLDAEVEVVENGFFGGNIAVAGLLVGVDVARTLAGAPPGRRYLLPDVCLSEGRFLDGLLVSDLPRPVEVVPSDGWSLRQALAGPR
jgi:putative radical SAM enzyme (TIGR03279 family)